MAAVNAPGQVVLSGSREAVEAVASAAALQGRQGRWLDVSHAFHSILMDPMLDAFATTAEQLTYDTPRIPVISTLTGKPVTQFTPAYWSDQVRGTVRFADAITHLKSLGVTRFLELGPDASLVAAIDETYDGDTLTLAALRRDRPEPTTAVTALARLWADGGDVDWTAFYTPAGARTVDLPTYAFQHQRYWPSVRREAVVASAADAVFWDAVERGDGELFAAEFGVDVEAPLRETLPAFSAWQRRRRERELAGKLRYEVSWAPVGSVGGVSADVSGHWLIVEPEPEPEPEPGSGSGSGSQSAGVGDGWAGALAGELAGRGVEVARLRLRPADLDRAVLAARLAEVAGSSERMRVVSFLGQDEREQPGCPGLPLGLAATTTLVQALADAGVSARVWSVSSGAVSTGAGEGLPHPVRAAVWGLGRVVALEEPDRWGGLADVPEQVSGAALARLVEVLAGGAGQEDQVAVRGGTVLGRRLVPAVLGDTVAGWAPSGTVLITGGTGALGARVARWAVERGAGHVVLVSRRGMGGEGARGLVADLRALGAVVDVVACDVAVRGEVEELFARFAVSAVVHTAGVLDDGVVDGLSAEGLAGVWGAKAGGAWNLHRASAGRELDAFVLFSSAAGVWGGAGQGAYAAANAALDGLVEYRRAQGLAGTSIAWGPWAEGGMADDATVLARMTRGGVRPLDPEAAVGILSSVRKAASPWLTWTGTASCRP